MLSVRLAYRSIRSCVPDEKRRVCAAATADEVGDRLHRFAADLQPVVAVPFAPGHAFGEPAAGEIPLPPLAGLQASVAAGREEPGERGPGVEQSSEPLSAGGEHPSALRRAAGDARPLRRVVARDSVFVRIPARDQRRQARAAEAARHVAAAIDEALGREPIEVGRLQVRMPHEAEVTPMLVI
jgi:hypothetical protein